MNPTALLHAKSDELQKNILSTYFSLRLGIVVFSFGLPLVLWGGGLLWGHIDHLAHSMSAYYGEGGGSMRNWFVGILWGVGFFLGAYSGFSKLEDWLLNLAGLFAIGVAMIPCGCWDGATTMSYNTLHSASAVLFFICMASVCFFCAKDTISLLPERRQKSFRYWYHAITSFLVASPLAAIVVSYMLSGHSSLVFFIEAFGVWTLGAYWLVKTFEFRITSAEELAAHGKVENRKGVGLVRLAS